MAADALSYLQRGGHKPGLERVSALLAAIGNPQKMLRILHIAGTNGKGSTAAMLESILRAAGLRTGLFTSPYLSDYRESIQLNGVPVSSDLLAKGAAKIRTAADALTDAPTEFELSVAVALWLFAQANCDCVILEAGLGGALDATNAIDTPVLSIITAIGLDHTRELGPTLADIAAAKAGIIKPHGTAISYGGVPQADAVIERVCRAQHATLYPVDFSALHVTAHDLGGFTFDYAGFTALHLPLAATYQPRNAATALTAIIALRRMGWHLPDAAVQKGLASVVWPGRFELLRRSPAFILDGSHNPHGMAATCESLRTAFPGEKFIFLMSVMADKDLASMLPMLLPLAEGFVTVAANNPRALPAAELAERIRAAGGRAESCDSIFEGVQKVLSASGLGPVCALGTLYFSADVRRAFLKLTNRQTNS